MITHLFCRCVTVNREDRFPRLAHWSLQMFAKQVLWPYKMHLCVKVPTLCFKHFLGATIFAWGRASVSGSNLANYCTFPNLIGNSGFHLHGAHHWPQQKDYASCTLYEKKIIINAQVEDFGSEQTRVLKPFDHWHFHDISSQL